MEDIMLRVGFIGFGTRASSFFENNMEPLNVCTLAAVCDPKADEIRKKWDEKYPDCHWYSDAEEMLNKESLDGVYVGTRCNLHTKYAMLVAKYDIPMFLEKPVAVNEEEIALLESIPHMDQKTVVSFPLRLAQLVTTVKDYIDRGMIGTLSQVQAYNNVHYGRIYYHGWYRDESITGGLFLQKATHDLDYINYVLGMDPVSLCAMETKSIFKGSKPAGVACKDCKEYYTCTESPYNVALYDPKRVIDDAHCCFATDTGNRDCATVMMQYANGVHAVYSQNFVARKGAGKRGARFIGYKGTIEFDFNSKTVTFFDHTSDRVDRISVMSSGGHSGGDNALATNFIDIMTKRDVSHSPLSQGVQSARLCLAAKRSAKTNTFIKL